MIGFGLARKLNEFIKRYRSEDRCDIWLGAMRGATEQSTMAQPRVWWGWKKDYGWSARRVRFELELGPIPAGAAVFHKCRDGRCIDLACMFCAPSGLGWAKKIAALRNRGLLDLCVSGHMLVRIPDPKIRLDRFDPTRHGFEDVTLDGDKMLGFCIAETDDLEEARQMWIETVEAARAGEGGRFYTLDTLGRAVCLMLHEVLEKARDVGLDFVPLGVAA